MRMLLLATLIFLGGIAQAAEEAGPNDLERLDQLVAQVEHKVKTATGGGAKQRSSRVDFARLNGLNFWQDLERDIVEMRHRARLTQERAMSLGVRGVNLTRHVNAFSDAYTKERTQLQFLNRKVSLTTSLSHIRQQVERLKRLGLQSGDVAADITVDTPRKAHGSVVLARLEKLLDKVEAAAKGQKAEGRKAGGGNSSMSWYYATRDEAWAAKKARKKARAAQGRVRKARASDDELHAEQALEQDIIAMRHMARIAQERAMRQGMKGINLTRCVNAISDAYVDRRSQTLGGDGKLSLVAAVEQMRQQIKRVRDFELPPGDMVATARQRGQEGLEALGDQELADMLWEKRTGIIKGDSNPGGLAASTVAAYLKTLTAAQREQFDALRLKYVRRGFSPADAEATALLELHGQLKARPDNYSREEVESLLER